MTAKAYKTIIIGGGISGLSCAYNLSEETKDFLLITENVGGRITTSIDRETNYGAYYVMDSYKYVNQFVEKKDKLSLQKSLFHQDKTEYTLFNLRFFLNIQQLLKLIIILKRFRKHYSLFKEECKYIPQVEALEKDPYLKELYNKNASEFISENGLAKLVNSYMAKVIYGTAFLRLDEISAYSFLQFTLPLISKSYSFRFLPDKITSRFKDQVEMDTVLEIQKRKEGYAIRTNKAEYEAKYIVLATPPNISNKLLSLDIPNNGVNVYMFHLNGKLLQKYQKYEFHFFDSTSSILVIAKQEDESFLLYSQDSNPKFERFFQNWNVISSHFWDPAFHLRKHSMLNSAIDENLFVIGDYNVCGLEDSYITGVYAANKILGKVVGQ